MRKKTHSEVVWIVEDDEAIGRCLQMLLQDAGYSTVLSGSLTEAREQMPKAAVVVLDYLLPDGNGLSFLPELGQRLPGTPVILLTAQSRVGTSSFPKHVQFLAKPFRNREFLDLVGSQIAQPIGAA